MYWRSSNKLQLTLVASLERRLDRTRSIRLETPKTTTLLKKGLNRTSHNILDWFVVFFYSYAAYIGIAYVSFWSPPRALVFQNFFTYFDAAFNTWIKHRHRHRPRPRIQ